MALKTGLHEYCWGRIYRMKNTEQVKRILMSALGVIICGISVGMFKHASLGVDPFQSLMSGLDAVIPIRFGTLYVIVNLLLLTFALIFDKHKIGLATLINLFLLGYIAEFSQGICQTLFPEIGIAGRFVLLMIAIVIMCLASAFYFTADLGVSTYDAVSLIWSENRAVFDSSIAELSVISFVSALERCSARSAVSISLEKSISGQS